MPSSEDNSSPILAFGPHPDDIEFACGCVIAKATAAGLPAHFVICSRGESGTFGTPEVRVQEAQKAAEILKATVEFAELDGDAHLEVRSAHVIQLAAILRGVRPEIVLAPSLVGNQHPDHWRLGTMVRDATRLARYGGVQELRERPPHTTAHLLFYAVSPEAEPRDITPVYFDVSAPEVIAQWTAAMEAHRSQTQARNYVEMQLTWARLNGARAGVQYAVPLFSNDPLLFDSLTALSALSK